MLKNLDGAQQVMIGIVVWSAAALGMKAVNSFTASSSYVSLRQMIPVGQSLEEAQILYEISRSDTRDRLASAQVTANKLNCVPESADSDSLIGYLENYCSDLSDLASAVERQEKQRDTLKEQGEKQLTAWDADIAGIQNVEKRTVEQNRLGRVRLEFTTLLRQAEEELAQIHATIRDGRDIELYVASLKHAGRMGSTAEAVRKLRNELSTKAGSFRSRTDDILSAWK